MAGTRARTADEAGPPLIAIALISAAALAYEILLMRLFSIILWHHFAYMIISLALLGYGASGVLLTLGRARRAAAFCAAVLCRRGGVRGQRDRLFRAGAAGAVQSAGDPLGPAPAGVPAGRLPAAGAALPVRRRLRVHGLFELARHGLAHLQLRHPGRRRGKPGGRGLAVRAAAAGRIEADRRAWGSSPRRSRGSNAAARGAGRRLR